MTVSIGRVLIIKGVRANGADEHPAIVTRVWGPGCVNVMALLDAEGPKPFTSVMLYPTREEADEQLNVGTGPIVAFWPERK